MENPILINIEQIWFLYCFHPHMYYVETNSYALIFKNLLQGVPSHAFLVNKKSQAFQIQTEKLYTPFLLHKITRSLNRKSKESNMHIIMLLKNHEVFQNKSQESYALFFYGSKSQGNMQMNRSWNNAWKFVLTHPATNKHPQPENLIPFQGHKKKQHVDLDQQHPFGSANTTRILTGSRKNSGRM